MKIEYLTWRFLRLKQQYVYLYVADTSRFKRNNAERNKKQISPVTFSLKLQSFLCDNYPLF